MLTADRPRRLRDVLRAYLCVRFLYLALLLAPPTPWGVRLAKYLLVWAKDDLRRIEEGDEC